MHSKSWIMASAVTVLFCLTLFPVPGEAALSTRDRGINEAQILDTLIYPAPGDSETWEISLPNGTYYVTLACGDPATWTGPHRVLLEGSVVVDDEETGTNEFYTLNYEPVTVSDGKLTMEVVSSGAGVYSEVNFIVIQTSVPSSPSYPIQVNFETSGTSTPGGYNKDYGLVYPNDVGGYTYGWDTNLSSNTRERGVNPDKTLDTVIYPGPDNTATWSIDIPNGTYFVTLACGDAATGTGPHRVKLEGQTVVDDEYTSTDTYVTLTNYITSVADEKLDVQVGGTSGYAEINYIIIDDTKPTISDFPYYVNFQPPTSPPVRGYNQDGGAVYKPARGKLFGWDTNMVTVDRDVLTNQLLDTYVNASPGETKNWDLELSNGSYYIYTGCGDALFPTGPHFVSIEGTTVVNNVSTAAGEFVEVNSQPITVTGGILDMQIGSAGYSMMNYLIIDDEAYSAPSFPVYINFQAPSNEVPTIAGGYDADYTPDTGDIFDYTAGRGWESVIYGLDRETNSDQRLDTYVWTDPGAQSTWQFNVPSSGTYRVTLRCGDAMFPTGPHYVTIEGNAVVNGQSTGADEYISVNNYDVSVTDGNLTLILGDDGASSYSMLNYIVIDQL